MERKFISLEEAIGRIYLSGAEFKIVNKFRELDSRSGVISRHIEVDGTDCGIYCYRDGSNYVCKASRVQDATASASAARSVG